MDTDYLAQQLGTVPYFDTLSALQREQVARLGSVRAYPPGDLILIEGHASGGLCILLSGRIRICKCSPQGQNAILAIFDPVILFNEVAALDGGPNPATVEALEESEIWQLSSERVETLLVNHPHLAVGLLKVMASRNRRLVNHFEDLSFRSVQARAAKLLLELSDGGLKPIDRRKFPNHQLAAQIATVPEAFSRVLRTFKTHGDIQCTPAILTVLHPERLAVIAGIQAGVGQI